MARRRTVGSRSRQNVALVSRPANGVKHTSTDLLSLIAEEEMTPDHEPKQLGGGAVSPFPPLPGSKRKLKKQVAQAVEEERETEWSEFPNLPGKRFSMRKAGRGIYELDSEESGVATASCRHTALRRFPRSITNQGQTYAWRRVGKRRFLAERRVVDLVNVATNVPVLRLSGLHFNFKAGTILTVNGQEPLHFPVRGAPSGPLMSATDGSGNRLIEYRLVRAQRTSLFDFFGWAEIVVLPTARTIPHIELLVAVSRQFLWGYFQSKGGGA
jgi:hypothetical protein